MSLKTALVTVGCAKNSADSDRLAAHLRSAGLVSADDPSSADAVIINTCGFIQAACEESLDECMELAALKSTGACRCLVVCGCLPARYGDELRRELPEADAVFGLVEDDAAAIAGFVRDRLLADGERPVGLDVQSEVGIARTTVPGTPTARIVPSLPYAYVKISDGCCRTCSFCTIPAIRGPYRSRSADDIAAEIDFLVRAGTKEIVLVGQETTSWGVDLGEGRTIARLLSELADAFDVWFRLMYMQPDGVGDDLIATIAGHDNICDYFDIPFQHASSAVLRSMHRTGDAKSHLELLARIRDAMPAAALRSSLIVGFPAETQGDFDELADFVRAARLDYGGVFAFSPEEGTPAAELPDRIPDDVATERQRMLVDLLTQIGWEKASARVGSTIDVILEGACEEEEYASEGRSQFQAPEVDGMCLLRNVEPVAGRLLRSRVEETDGYDMICGPA